MTTKSPISRSLPVSIFAAVFAFATAMSLAQIPQDGLVAHYKFDGDTNDARGSFDGTTPNRALTFSDDTPPGIDSSQSGVFDRFNGIGDYVGIDNGILNNYAEDYTAAAWFKADFVPRGAARLVVFESENFLISLGLREDPNNSSNTLVQFFTRLEQSAPSIDISVPSSSILEWNHAAVVYDSTSGEPHGELRAYLNGLLLQTIPVDSPFATPPVPSFFNIGTFRDANGRFFSGNLDDVAIWERALSPNEISAIVNPRFDVNGDGFVSVADLAAVQSAVLINSTDLVNDINGDGEVDGLDAGFFAFLIVGVGFESRIVENLSDDPNNADSLRHILANAQTGANGGTLITFDASLDGGTLTLSSGQLEVLAGSDVFIDASKLPNGLTIDANQQSRVLLIDENATAAFHGLTFTGGRTSDGDNGSDGSNGGNGGGIFANTNSTLTLSACTVSSNQTGDGGDGGGGGRGGRGGFGGGIFADFNSTLTLSTCTIDNNQAGNGGAGGNSDGGAGAGGGIFVDFNGSLTLTASTISGNQAGVGGDGRNRGGDGGGILASSGSSLSLNASTINNNQAGDRGGGIFLLASSTSGINSTLNACTISGNKSRVRGGGLFFRNIGADSSLQSLNLIACTISDNSAVTEGGGVFLETVNLTLNDSILAMNSAPVAADLQILQGGASTTVTGNNLFSDLAGSGLMEAPGTVTRVSDPLLAPLGDYGGPTQTMIPLPGSPAINNAPDSTRSTDQRGLPITDGSPDIGAAEFQGNSDLAPLFDIDHDGDGNTFGVEFALGTDPFTPDASNPANLTFTFNETGQPVLSFGYNPDAVGFAEWVLERSPDLATWTPVDTSIDPGMASEIIDPTAGEQFFYRFRAKLTDSAE